jgi:hypothetical protein
LGNYYKLTSAEVASVQDTSYAQYMGILGIRYAAEARDLAGRIRYPISQKGKCGRAMTSSGLKEYELKFGLSGIFIAKFIGNG